MSLRKEIVSKQLKIIDLLQQKTESGDLIWEYTVSKNVSYHGKFTGFKTAFFLNGEKVSVKISDYNFRIILDFSILTGSGISEVHQAKNQMLISGLGFKPKAMILSRTVRDKFHPVVSKLNDLLGAFEQGTFKSKQSSKLAANLPLDGLRAIDLGDDD